MTNDVIILLVILSINFEFYFITYSCKLHKSLKVRSKNIDYLVQTFLAFSSGSFILIR